MDSTLPPEAWRSEAFAEDLADNISETPGPAERSRAALLMLLGVPPVVVATAGAVVVTLSGA